MSLHIELFKNSHCLFTNEADTVVTYFSEEIDQFPPILEPSALAVNFPLFIDCRHFRKLGDSFSPSLIYSFVVPHLAYRWHHLVHAGNSAVSQCINSTCGPDVIDFMTEAVGQMKIDHRPHLAPGPDFGHVCLRPFHPKSQVIFPVPASWKALVTRVASFYLTDVTRPVGSLPGLAALSCSEDKVFPVSYPPSSDLPPALFSFS